MTRLVSLIVTLAAMLWATEEIRSKRPRSHQTERLASIESLDWLVGNYQHIVSDYYWLRAVEHFGNLDAHTKNYPLLGPLLERSLRLDGQFFKPAYVGGTILNTGSDNLKLSQQLVLDAMKFHPNRWELPFIVGFNSYMYLDNITDGIRYLEIASKLPGCPDRIPQIVARLSVEAAQPRIALALTDTMMETVTDPELLKTYEERRRKLLLEVEIGALQRGVEFFESEYQRLPSSLQEVMKLMGQAEPTLQDPLGGSYFLSPEGQVKTTSEEERIRFSQDAKEQRR